MNVIVSEDDFLQVQNLKLKEHHKKRIISPIKDVRVEARVEKLEIQVSDISIDLKMLNKTMIDVATTLKDIREDQKKIQLFEVQKAMLERDIADNKKLIELVFEKHDKLQEKVQIIEKTDAGNAVKIGNSERVVWFIIMGAIGALGWFKGGNS